MLDMAEIPTMTTDFEISYNIIPMAEFAPDFNAIMVKANKIRQLGFNAVLNFTVGEEYIGKPAYIFRLNDTATAYDLIETTEVNIIGNVVFTSDKITDFIILIGK
jgi:uncharacterized protein (UPF0297 family)